MHFIKIVVCFEFLNVVYISALMFCIDETDDIGRNTSQSPICGLIITELQRNAQDVFPR